MVLVALLAWIPIGAARAELVAASEPVFAGRGVIVLWAILRGFDATSSLVVLRILPEDPTLGAFAVDLADRAGEVRAGVTPAAQLGSWEEVRVARARFVEHPRIELHLARGLEDLLARPPRPAVTLFFLGIPATTPELASEAALSAYFAGALIRARARQPARTPPR